MDKLDLLTMSVYLEENRAYAWWIRLQAVSDFIPVRFNVGNLPAHKLPIQKDRLEESLTLSLLRAR